MEAPYLFSLFFFFYRLFGMRWEIHSVMEPKVIVLFFCMCYLGRRSLHYFLLRQRIGFPGRELRESEKIRGLE